MSHHHLDQKAPVRAPYRYTSSNVIAHLEPGNETAFSYGWWQFLARVNGKLVLSTYPYSPSTQRQIAKTRRTLEDLGIEPDLIVECPEGLQRNNWEQEVLSFAMNQYDILKDKEKKGRKGTWASDHRLREIAYYETMLQGVKEL